MNTPANEWREEIPHKLNEIALSRPTSVGGVIIQTFDVNVLSAFIESYVTQTLNQHSAQIVESGKYNSDKLWGEGYYKGIMDERNRIEEMFKKELPPHAMDLEDSVWLKRLLNKAFQHDKKYN